MITITLPPELEQAVCERAQQQGTTPELYLLADLRDRYLLEVPHAIETEIDQSEGETMADFFAGYAGTVNSREIIPGGVHLSKDTGRRFTELMLKKYRGDKG